MWCAWCGHGGQPPRPVFLHQVGELFLSKASDYSDCRYELRCIIWKTAQMDLGKSLSGEISDIYVKG